MRITSNRTKTRDWKTCQQNVLWKDQSQQYRPPLNNLTHQMVCSTEPSGTSSLKDFGKSADWMIQPSISDNSTEEWKGFSDIFAQWRPQSVVSQPLSPLRDSLTAAAQHRVHREQQTDAKYFTVLYIAPPTYSELPCNEMSCMSPEYIT